MIRSGYEQIQYMMCHMSRDGAVQYQYQEIAVNQQELVSKHRYLWNRSEHGVIRDAVLDQLTDGANTVMRLVAPTEKDAKRIYEEALRQDRALTVASVLWYTEPDVDVSYQAKVVAVIAGFMRQSLIKVLDRASFDGYLAHMRNELK